MEKYSEPYRGFVVAGHICLDIIPEIPLTTGGMASIMQPGKLVDVGKAVISTGGAVSNTGLALHQFGMAVKLVGKVGDDPFGHLVLEYLRQRCPQGAASMIREPDAATSYTVVLNVPGTDRIFLHCPGANDTFVADDIESDVFVPGNIFHFGYPPLMARMFQDDGRECVDVFRRAQAAGMMTSLDMALPDPASSAGEANWPEILDGLLPHVDLFLPSIDELLYMTGRRDVGDAWSRELLLELTDSLLAMGPKVILVKLGAEGIYLRTGSEAPWDLPSWRNVEMYHPGFRVSVAGATGAGDVAISGFLAALGRGLSVRETLQLAAGAGACCCKAADAFSGIPDWETLRSRIQDGWEKRAPAKAFNMFPFESDGIIELQGR